MITTIRLQHFRSYSDASFELSPGVNIIVGPNASGKTNLLEAILLVLRGNSYRTRDSNLVRFQADWSRLDVNLPDQKRVVKLTGSMPDSVEKIFEIDDQRLSRLHTSRMLPVVLFEPDHLLLLGGSPDGRRVFLDDLIEQISPQFGAVRRQYRRVLAHRNALLKRNPHDLVPQLFVWNLRLSELAGQIVRERVKLIDIFSDYAQDLYTSLSGDAKKLTFSYICRFPLENYETTLLKKLEQSVPAEVARGFTAYGPHRDDLGVFVDDRLISEVASRGEARTIILVLKILELHILQEKTGQKPVLLLDDVFSELDTSRRQALTRHVAGYQTFITTTDADVVIHHFTDCNIIPLTKE